MKTMMIALSFACFQVTALVGVVDAATLATGLMYWDDGSTGTSCFVTNVGSKPVIITSATLQDAESTNLAAPSNNCTTAPLAPGHTCFFDGANVAYGGGKIEVKGNTKSLRGRCVLRNAINGDVLGSAADMR